VIFVRTSLVGFFIKTGDLGDIAEDPRCVFDFRLRKLDIGEKFVGFSMNSSTDITFVNDEPSSLRPVRTSLASG
jgi:hypothetical protein